ncbi:MAG TPA: hypothetical protein VH349_10985 [Ktedonobacterales bacterium]|jgi:hypothetical protein
MPNEPVELAKINITYRRDPGASEVMTLSDGANDAILYLSPLGGMNMLLEVIDALLQLIPYGGEHSYYWEGDQDYYRWLFQLDSETLDVKVTQSGETLFSITCSVWQFAAKLRLCASRLAVAEDAHRPHGGDWIRNYTSYQQLSALLDARKANR